MKKMKTKRFRQDRQGAWLCRQGKAMGNAAVRRSRVDKGKESFEGR
jgi:hypothetical protein